VKKVQDLILTFWMAVILTDAKLEELD